MLSLRYCAAHSSSRLEDRFLMLWKHTNGPPLEREYRFRHERRWRADFAQMEARVLIEIEGGIWVNGRHNHARDSMPIWNRADWREGRWIPHSGTRRARSP